MITRIQPDSRMSQAVIHGQTIYLAGQVGEPGEDVAAQTQTALAEVEAKLATPDYLVEVIVVAAR